LTDQRFIYIAVVVINATLGFTALGRLIADTLQDGRVAIGDQSASWLILIQSVSIGLMYLLIMAAVVHQTKTTRSSKYFNQITYWWDMIRKEEGPSNV
jgi:hypothetical protein